MIRVGRELLLNQLEAVSPGLSPKGVTEQSNCFVFAEGMLYTFNDEIACSHVSLLGNAVTGAVTASPLLDLLRKMTEDEIEVEATDEHLKVKGKGRKAGVTMQREVKLDIAEIGKPGEKYRQLSSDFLEGLAMVRECASDDPGEYRFGCVHFTPKAIEATDNFQIGRFRFDTGFSENLLIRKTSVRHVIDLEMSKVAEGGSWMHFKAGKELRLSCRLARNEDFPELRSAFKVEGVQTRLPKGLKEAADRASVFFTDEKSQNVRIELEDGKLMLKHVGTVGYYQENRKIDYAGPPLKFTISAKLLSHISERYNECEISPGRLIVRGGRFSYLSCLKIVGERETVKKSKPED